MMPGKEKKMPWKDKTVRNRKALESYHKKRKERGEYRPRTHPKTCPVCGVDFFGRRKESRYCSMSCAAKDCCRRGLRSRWIQKRGEHSPNYKGKTNNNGYVYLHRPGHPLADKQGYVAEHRLVMADHMGRPLSRLEFVHHKNRNRADNRIENLELVSGRDHMAEHWGTKSVICPKCHHVFIAAGPAKS
jgi:hypothetical protein